MTSTSRRITSHRRTFLKGLTAAGALTFTGTVAGTAARRPLRAWADAYAETNTVLVSIFLRGAADGLNIIPPHGDDDYYVQRPVHGLRAGDFIDLDGFFGLHNAFSPLLEHWNEGRVAVVHATGSHDETRSHFRAMPNMDTAFGTTGWMNRAIEASLAPSVEAGLSVGFRTNAQLAGPWSGRVVRTVTNTVNAGVNLEATRPALEEMYGDAAMSTIEQVAVQNALNTIDDLSSLDPMPGEFPSTPLGNDLREAASLIRANIGIRAVAIDSGGWDHHSGGLDRMNQYGSQLASALNAFLNDLGADGQRVIVCVSSEFGRTVKFNGSDGTDHGHGNMMMVLGDPLIGMGGAKVLTPGGWPGLSDAAIWRGVGLDITTDFRSVYAELIDRHLGIDNTAAVFPGLVREHVGLLYETGDVNGSGVIGDGDVQTLLDGNVTNGSNRAGDIDRDGDTDLRDALQLAQHVGNP